MELETSPCCTAHRLTQADCHDDENASSGDRDGGHYEEEDDEEEVEKG